MNLRAVEWRGTPEAGGLRFLDQTLLPRRTLYRECRTLRSVWRAIRTLQIRGAPVIGVAAAYGVWLGARARRNVSAAALRHAVRRAVGALASARPTAVNLFWALDRMRDLVDRSHERDPRALRQALFHEADAICASDRETCRRIGVHGARLLRDGAAVLTHCNAGALATAGIGTALAAVYVATDQGKSVRVFADETRPVLQGARLTAWELARAGIDVTLLPDVAAATLLAQRKVDCVIVGADRVAANGDFANKIGTLGVATLARVHGVPFYVAAPLSSFDPDTPDGRRIPIEERDGREVTEIRGVRIAPRGVKTFNPAFDVTPAACVTAFVTEAGVLRPPFARAIRAARARARAQALRPAVSASR